MRAPPVALVQAPPLVVQLDLDLPRVPEDLAVVGGQHLECRLPQPVMSEALLQRQDRLVRVRDPRLVRAARRLHAGEGGAAELLEEAARGERVAVGRGHVVDQEDPLVGVPREHGRQGRDRVDGAGVGLAVVREAREEGEPRGGRSCCPGRPVWYPAACARWLTARLARE